MVIYFQKIVEKYIKIQKKVVRSIVVQAANFLGRMDSFLSFPFFLLN
jgi:hypothetical protein